MKAIRDHLEGLFPKTCRHCHRRFASLREFLELTTPQGPAIPYDAQVGDWRPAEPMGTVTLANCRCGTTLALSSHGMPLPILWKLLNWARVETKRHGVSPQELLGYLRDEITRQVLAEPGKGKP